jgi:hypothetical protein
MSEIYQKDESIHEPTTAHMHPLETTPQGSQADSAEGQHEHRDVIFSALINWFVGLFAIIVVAFVLMWGFFNWAVAGTKANDEIPSAMFTQRDHVERSWPNPRDESPLQKVGEVPTLLAEPEEPMKELRAQENEDLENYGWAKDESGRKTGAVTIPIERAIDLTAKRGLPADNKTKLRPSPDHAAIVRPGATR